MKRLCLVQDFVIIAVKHRKQRLSEDFREEKIKRSKNDYQGCYQERAIDNHEG